MDLRDRFLVSQAIERRIILWKFRRNRKFNKIEQVQRLLNKKLSQKEAWANLRYQSKAQAI